MANPFRYVAGYHDTETGLTKFGTRYYDPGYGRWTQQDPTAGSIGDPSTVNRYSYAGSNPISYVDPSGYSLLGDIAESVGRAFDVANVAELVQSARRGRRAFRAAVAGTLSGAAIGSLCGVGVALSAPTLVGGVIAGGGCLLASELTAEASLGLCD